MNSSDKYSAELQDCEHESGSFNADVTVCQKFNVQTKIEVRQLECDAARAHLIGSQRISSADTHSAARAETKFSGPKMWKVCPPSGGPPCWLSAPCPMPRAEEQSGYRRIGENSY
ncbi:hypothetical protein NLI96_g439 [Meripilus lineatus]|uniref:Uncharacterized protein n=1 Tax=Meripilus lineatus TaxID=2056292 RepID=A0AAD5VC95_9APHY|nr:hypothetical protein NLI96_g439 [Physisporinus lineatus]